MVSVEGGLFCVDLVCRKADNGGDWEGVMSSHGVLGPRGGACGGATSLVAVAQVHVLGKSKEGLAAWRR